MVLSTKFVEKARRELGENEETNKELLSQFRGWITGHRFIRRCRQDDSFLLQFLRIRKFNFDNSCESFEKFFLFRKKYEKWCNFDDVAMKRLWELFDLGFAYPLSERDDEGKRIIFVQTKKFDTEKFNSTDAIRLLAFIVMVLMEEEETQISGISTITDFTDVSFNYFRLFSIRDIRDFADCAKNASIGREKENFFVNLPSFAAFLFEIGRNALNDKLRQRLIVTKSMDQLKSFLDSNLLPKEFGGSTSEQEMMNEFRKLFKIHEKNISTINDFEIDWNEVRGKGNCTIM